MAQEQGIAVGIKNAIARGEYVRAASIEDFITNEHATVKARLLSIPGKIADRLDGKSREEREAIIRDEICEVLAELAEADNDDGHAETMNDGGAPN